MSEKYTRLLKTFKEGDLVLAHEVIREALRKGDFDSAQEALDSLRSNAPPSPYSIKTTFEEAGRVLTLLRGPKGAVQFLLNMRLPTNHEENIIHDASVMAWDLGYHSPKPMYEGHEPMEGVCPYIGTTCYYDGSGLNAQRFLPELIKGGGKILEEYLIKYYNLIFEDKEDEEEDED